MGTIKTKLELRETMTKMMIRVDEYRKGVEGELASSSSRLFSSFDSEKLDVGA